MYNFVFICQKLSTSSIPIIYLFPNQAERTPISRRCSLPCKSTHSKTIMTQLRRSREQPPQVETRKIQPSDARHSVNLKKTFNSKFSSTLPGLFATRNATSFYFLPSPDPSSLAARVSSRQLLPVIVLPCAIFKGHKWAPACRCEMEKEQERGREREERVRESEGVKRKDVLGGRRP